MKERIANGLLVVVVTALIWLYLEAESLTTSQQEIRVTFVSPTGDMLVGQVGDEWRGSATIRVEGSQSALSRAPRAIEVPVGSPGFPAVEGEQTVDLRVPLRANRELQRAGVNLVEVNPQTVRLRLEAITTLPDVEIRADLSGIEPAAPPVVEPLRASVRGPRSSMERIASLSGGAHVVAVVRAGNFADGQAVTVRAALEPPPSVSPDHVVITPREAEVEFTIRTRSATATIPSAPVQLLTPPAESGRFRVEIEADDAFVTGVTVSGPSELVEQVRSGQMRIVALLWLTSDELERPITSKMVSFGALRDGQVVGLPAGLSVRAADAQVQFTVTPVSAPGP
ncbi:MAG: hypothetical protein IBJ10_10575 [Phycisphaerales bacterium]|nr:hypothetical protein [Phycisphaerales bacterium]